MCFLFFLQIYKPFPGVILNILPYFVMILLIADDMVVISLLPYIFTIFLIAKPFECGYKTGNC